MSGHWKVELVPKLTLVQKSTVVYTSFQDACIGALYTTYLWNNYIDIQLLIMFCIYVLQLCNCICATSHAMLLHYCKSLLQLHEIHFYRKVRHYSSYICMLSSNTYVRHYVNIYIGYVYCSFVSKEKGKAFILFL